MLINSRSLDLSRLLILVRVVLDITDIAKSLQIWHFTISNSSVCSRSDLARSSHLIRFFCMKDCQCMRLVTMNGNRIDILNALYFLVLNKQEQNVLIHSAKLLCYCLHFFNTVQICADIIQNIDRNQAYRFLLLIHNE